MSALEREVRRLLGFLRVWDFPGMAKRRYGQDGDGGYVLLEPVLREHVSSLWSFGVGDDASFEAGVLDAHPSVTEARLYDPNVAGPPFPHPAFRFERRALSPDLMGWAGRRSLLKVDVEHAEWSAILWSEQVRAATAVFEFHFLPLAVPAGLSPYFREVWGAVADGANAQAFKSYGDALARICRTHWCFHAHVNNSLPPVEVGGVLLPPLVEMSFVHKALVPVPEPADPGAFPVEGLDHPNKTDRPDVRLPDWRAAG